ncbi:MAG: PaaI family thioesterase [Pseudomonadota bacterium]
MNLPTKTVEEGEFAGWLYYPEEPFEAKTAGPFFFREDERGPVAAFRVEHKHLNGAGVAHGGLLMTFADVALFAIAGPAFAENEYGFTVAFASEFLDGPREGEYVEARGDLLRAGGTLLFARGLITAEGRPCLNFSGTIKRIRIKG